MKSNDNRIPHFAKQIKPSLKIHPFIIRTTPSLLPEASASQIDLLSSRMFLSKLSRVET